MNKFPAGKMTIRLSQVVEILLVVLAIAGTAGCGMLGCGKTDTAVPAPAVPPSHATAQLSGVDANAPVKFEDVTEKAGIHFLHQNSKTPRKYLVETMGSGGAFIDYDGDGYLDVLLLNNKQIPG